MAIHRYLQILDIFHLRSLGGHIIGGDASVTSPWKGLLKPGAARSHQMASVITHYEAGHGFWRWMDSLCVWNVSQSFRLHKLPFFSEHDIFTASTSDVPRIRNVCFHGMIPMALPRKKGVLFPTALFFFFAVFLALSVAKISSCSL